MANQPTNTKPPGSKPSPAATAAPKSRAPSSALRSPDNQAWLRAELEQAEYEEQFGPSGEGWTHNESLRASTEERAEFLRALVAVIEAVPAA
jgi:hypothetical protein